MDINFEALKQIPKLVALTEELIKLQKEGTIEKKWLSIEEMTFYLNSYSRDKLYKLVQEEWIEGVHYHKPTGKLIFNKHKINDWVEGKDNQKGTKLLIDDMFSSIQLDK